MTAGVKISVDTGGTFTDICLLDENSGELTVGKVSSTPENPALAVISGICKMLSKCSLAPGSVSVILHGTTVATNALLEKRVTNAALLLTRGFRDILYIGRQTRPSLYNFKTLKPPPLIPRRYTFEVEERVLPNGEARNPLNEAQVFEIAAHLRSIGIESVAVSLLHSYINPAHEQRIKKILAQACPGAYITLSSEVLPEFREYERTCATAVSALVRPHIDCYLGSLEKEMARKRITANLMVMHSGGGVITSTRARTECARTVLSGPAGGVLAGIDLGRHTGLTNIITLDIGGTSTDISLIRDGTPCYTSEGQITGYPLPLPMIDIHTIGAGGGSIVWLDPGGALRVGPRSAGSRPGPACYGTGGDEPTVTDANLLLGRISPSSSIGDKEGLSCELAHRVIEKNIAQPLQLAPELAAEGIIKVVNSNMARAVRVVSVQRGYDVREYALMAFGGAGPLHAAMLAQDLGIPRAVIPRYPGVTSALGMLRADVRLDLSRVFVASLGKVDPGELFRHFLTMEKEGMLRLASEGFTAGQSSISRLAGLRYTGQSTEITLPVPEGILGRVDLDRIRTSFHLAHQREYGWQQEQQEVELVNLRLTALGRLPKRKVAAVSSGCRDIKPVTHRQVYFEGFVNTPVFRRESLSPGVTLAGPAVVEQDDATTLIPPGMAALCDPYGNLIIELEA